MGFESDRRRRKEFENQLRLDQIRREAFARFAKTAPLFLAYPTHNNWSFIKYGRRRPQK